MNKADLINGCIKSSKNGCNKIYEKESYDMLLALYEILREINEEYKIKETNMLKDNLMIVVMKYNKLIHDSLSQYDDIVYGDKTYKILVFNSDNSIVIHIEVI
ncbi:MAG: hypothetical protein ACRCXT_24255 [Paraclostridium sp.]